MVDQLCQAYHWGFDDAMRMTLPQIIMLNHGSRTNYKRAESRAKGKANRTTQQQDDAPVYGGKKLEELNSNEMRAYYSDMGGF